MFGVMIVQCLPTSFVFGIINLLFLTLWQVEVDEEPTEAKKDEQDNTTEVLPYLA